mmetsp:Transcript_14086/g.17463  ORF Transcript_14086/g.17463 Transcript_14086/m.17463 type:complete len:192 (-) Transcript_14086:1167-1742(-)
MDAPEPDEPSMGDRVFAQLGRKFQHLLDKSTIYLKSRWAFSFFMLCLYGLRVHLAEGWYIITYGLGIYLLQLFIGFLSPQVDPETEGLVLPTDSSAEFKPFSRRLPEFKFWYSATKAVFTALFLAMFRMFDIPVFWPILLIYWMVLFFLTMKRQILHMIKYRYVPWSTGKTKYKGKDALHTPGSAPAAKGK